MSLCLVSGYSSEEEEEIDKEKEPEAQLKSPTTTTKDAALLQPSDVLSKTIESDTPLADLEDEDDGPVKEWSWQQRLPRSGEDICAGCGHKFGEYNCSVTKLPVCSLEVCPAKRLLNEFEVNM
jgi:hypothetical protein